MSTFLEGNWNTGVQPHTVISDEISLPWGTVVLMLFNLSRTFSPPSASRLLFRADFYLGCGSCEGHVQLDGSAIIQQHTGFALLLLQSLDLLHVPCKEHLGLAAQIIRLAFLIQARLFVRNLFGSKPSRTQTPPP
ncbi:hypothetical protein A0H81_08534 [Grifola frondosa]|uniref:Uncharacterized protein n=1 Tax=Grifola frondosa TaxID=5627 RepID=A0A1C7M812_GRIFR|nr:hypothetical protein A0H81_08534 [Grifola frondosa]